MGNKQKTAPTNPGQKSKSLAKVKGAGAAGTGNFLYRARRYFQASQVELQKVSWPIAKEVRVTGYAVAALVAVMAVFLGLADVLLAWGIKAFLSIGI